MTLTRYFPEMAKSVVERHAQYIAIKSAQLRMKKIDAVITATRELWNEGIYPSRRKIEERIGTSILHEEFAIPV